MSALAEDKPMVIQNGDARAERVKEFSGVLDLQVLRAAGKDPAVVEIYRHASLTDPAIVNQKGLEALFENWMLGDPPAIDFSKQVLTVATWGGSGINMSRGVDDEGNLSVIGRGGTKDIVRGPSGGPGLTYLIEVFSLSGIKSVNGQKWPSPAQEAELDGAGQPSTAPGSKTESGEKPKLESKGRSQ